ncbi:MAG: TrmH family RNA methyltransferase [Patescibacteria group bacterium]
MQKIHISGSENDRIKQLKKLNQKKFRQKSGMFFIENLKTAHDAAKSGILPIQIFVTEEFEERNKKEVDFILKKSGVKEIYAMSPKVNRKFSNLDTPAGFAAVYKNLNAVINLSKPVIYLNAISDPGNLGTMLRSALAFGIDNVVLDEECADLYNFKTLSAAKDSFFKLRIEYDHGAKLLKVIKKQMPVYATKKSGGQSPDFLRKQKKIAIILGNESLGVDKNLLKMADGFITIKTSGRVESLNVAAAAAIIFYEIFQS